ncbi:MAG: hypothetical protein ACP5NG_03895 [Conexivisphaera sp.]
MYRPLAIASEAPVLLAYPSGDAGTALRVAEELEALGVEGVALAGRSLVGNLAVLGKGKSSIVLLCSVGGRPAAAKIRRVDSPAPDMRMEARMLRAANSVGVGPGLIGWMDDVVLMELVEGEALAEHLRRIGPRSPAAARPIRAALDEARALDSIGVDHGELHHPGDHVMVTAEGAEILDFGSASASRRTSNVTSLAGAIARMIGASVEGKLLGALRSYKERPSDASYEEVLEALGIQAR